MLTLQDCDVFAEGLDHPECIAFHLDGSLWAGGEAGQIYRITTGGKVKEVINTGGFVLGLAFSPGCEWLAICDLGNKCVWRLDMTTMHLSLFADGVAGHRFSIPNYAVFDGEGNMYVSESGAFRTVSGKILKFTKDGEGEIWYDEPLNFANGMAMAPDGKSLFVVTSFLPGVKQIFIKEDGSAGKRRVYCTLPETVPDGLAFDIKGNLYVSCYAPNTIYRVDPDRGIQTLINDWEAHTLTNPTNIAFGGSNFDEIYSANLGRWHITRIKAGIQGLPLVSHQNKKS